MRHLFIIPPIKPLLLLSFLVLFSCTEANLGSDDNDSEITIELNDTDFEPTDWTEATHSKDADPNFDEVFEDNAVKRLDIVVDSERWEAMLADMSDLYGNFGASGRPGSLVESDDDPIFVPAEVFYKEF